MNDSILRNINDQLYRQNQLLKEQIKLLTVLVDENRKDKNNYKNQHCK